MCKCCCEKEKTPIEEYLSIHNKEVIGKEELRRTKMEYVHRNIPMILDLVKRYNELLKNNPDTYKEAEDLTKLKNSLAEQIVNYTG